ncbi:hypothetical protein [Clostridium perfringens]|uniref:hypothetical protein n=1 Tax=Clostridium perfringens TaxID=1502 RepID=UPI001A23478F|nr:hypothetical protein [Clostridium perfringens]MDM0837752.1 hypothetical protein [Clostridium perfringens]MDU1258402.1 hypothetical protein [Clostridium perfringens]HAT4115600.1 hypothetical protein [Clostridium perfringens]
MKEKTIDEIHDEHMNDDGRDKVNDLYKKVYLNYINLIENNNLDIKQEITFVKLKMNKHNNEMLNYYMNLFISIISGVSVSIITVFITSNDIIKLTLGLIILFLFVYFTIIKNSKYDIKEVSNQKKYYSVCLLVLNDLEEELL